MKDDGLEGSILPRWCDMSLTQTAKQPHTLPTPPLIMWTHVCVPLNCDFKRFPRRWSQGGHVCIKSCFVSFIWCSVYVCVGEGKIDVFCGLVSHSRADTGVSWNRTDGYSDSPFLLKERGVRWDGEGPKHKLKALGWNSCSSSPQSGGLIPLGLEQWVAYFLAIKTII